MKNIIATFILTFSIISGFSQQHLSFKGVSIDGTLKEYTKAMQLKGFTLQGMENGCSLLSGDFAGYKECVVMVSTLNNKDLVNKIIVIFSEHDTWKGLYDNYSLLQEMLTEKYGDPSENKEYFDGKNLDDQDKMIELTLQRCHYYTIYETDLGNIELSMECINYNKCVVLQYYDKANSAIVRQAAIDDL